MLAADTENPFLERLGLHPAEPKEDGHALDVLGDWVSALSRAGKNRQEPGLLGQNDFSLGICYVAPIHKVVIYPRSKEVTSNSYRGGVHQVRGENHLDLVVVQEAPNGLACIPLGHRSVWSVVRNAFLHSPGTFNVVNFNIWTQLMEFRPEKSIPRGCVSIYVNPKCQSKKVKRS